MENQESKSNKTENIDNHNSDIDKFDNIRSKCFNIIQNQELKYRYNCPEECSSRKKDDVNIFSLISNYKEKLLNKKAYFCEASKYFLTRYLKGRKCIDNYTSRPIHV